MAFNKGGVVASIVSKWDDRGVRAAQRDFAKMAQTTKKSSTAVKGFNDSLKGLGVTLGTAAVVGGMVAFAKNAVQMAIESKRTIVRIEQIAKSMGVFYGVMGGTTDRLTQYAQSLQDATGVSDETVKSGQAILLTFKEIATSAGDAGGMFDRATAALLDLSAAGFGEVEQNAKSLGKALNDPVKGLTALGRQGITFTEQEKAKVKALVASGKAFEAQNVIMSAVEMQVGGVAEAVSNDFDKISAAAADAQEQIGYALVDATDRASQAFGGSGGIIEQIRKAGEQTANLVAGVGLLVDGFATLGGVLPENDRRWDALMRLDRIVNPVQRLLAQWNEQGERVRLQDEAQQRRIDTIANRYGALAASIRGAAAAQFEEADAQDEAARKTLKHKSAVDRLKQSLDLLNGKNQSRIEARLNLRELRREGPAQSGERKGADGKITNFTTRDDRIAYALQYTQGVESLALALGGGKKSAQAIDMGREYITSIVGKKMANQLLQTPNMQANPRGWEGYYSKGGTSIVIEQQIINTSTPAEAIEQTKRWARLSAAGRGPVAPAKAIG